MRYFFHMAYHGFHYRGWQRQPAAASIQQIVEDKLAPFLQRKTPIIGCGRTDAQVHASQYFFHLDTEVVLIEDFVDIFNKVLPPNLSVYDVFEVAPTLHAQLSATQRTYNYLFHTRKDPFLSELSSYYPIKKLDLAAMQEALNLLPRYTDYYGFCKTPDQHSTTQCNITHARILTNASQNLFRVEISSNRFLRGMIRMLVGKLLKIGQHQMTVEELERGIAEKCTPQFLDLAYPQGLYLTRVEYPGFHLPPRETVYWRD